MQDIPDLKYKLVLFVGSEPIELERKDDRTWAPIQRPYVPRLLTTYTHRNLWLYRDISPTSHVGVEIQIKRGHLPWAKKDQNIKEIDIKKPFNEYWASNAQELTVPGRSSSQPVRSYLIEGAEVIVVGKYRCSVELHLSASPTVRLFATTHRFWLIMAA